MSTLNLIRSLRQTLAALREADGPIAVSRIARQLAAELEADLDPDNSGGMAALASIRTARDAALDEDRARPSELEMAVYA
jgi:hypothetical protein